MAEPATAATPAGLRARPEASVRVGVLVAATAMACTSTGEVVLLGTLLGLAAGQLAAGAVGVLGGLSVALRWDSTSLEAVAGAQGVLGPAGAVGSAAAMGAAWCAAGGLVLASPRGWAALPFGLSAGLAVAGPSVADAGDLAVRLAGAAAGVGLALGAARWEGPGRRRAAAALTAAALALAVVA